MYLQLSPIIFNNEKIKSILFFSFFFLQWEYPCLLEDHGFLCRDRTKIYLPVSLPTIYPSTFIITVYCFFLAYLLFYSFWLVFLYLLCDCFVDWFTGPVTVMCYNVLCEKYATTQMYGYCPSWALSWDYRKKVILGEIRHYTADIITLQVRVSTREIGCVFIIFPIKYYNNHVVIYMWPSSIQ